MSSTEPASASPMPAGVTDPNYKPLPGRLGNLTMLQLHALEKLKKELKEEGKFVSERMDDATLLRSVSLVHAAQMCTRRMQDPTLNPISPQIPSRPEIRRAQGKRDAAQLRTMEERFRCRRSHTVRAPSPFFFFASSHRCPHPRLSNFDFKEKAAVDKYYPQYYHKMDIVRPPVLR